MRLPSARLRTFRPRVQTPAATGTVIRSATSTDTTATPRRILFFHPVKLSITPSHREVGDSRAWTGFAGVSQSLDIHRRVLQAKLFTLPRLALLILLIL